MGRGIQKAVIAGVLCVLASCFGRPVWGAWVATGPFGGNAEVLATSATDAQLLLAGTKNANLFLSRNGGENWQQISFPRQYTSMLHTLVIDPRNPSIFFAAIADGAGPGLYRSADAGKSWKPVAGLGNDEVYSLSIWHQDPKVMAAGLRRGVWISRDAGESWKPISPADSTDMQPVVSVAIDPQNADVIYAGTPRLPWKSTDGGNSWNLIAEGMSTDSDIITVRVDVSRPSRVFIGACSGFWRSTNSGELWSKMAGIPFTSRRTYAFVQDPAHPEVIFAGTSRGLYRTRDGGAEWKNIGSHEIKSLAMGNDVLYIATADAGLFKSTDFGTTLTPINEGFTSRNFAPLNEAGELLYTGTKFEMDAGSIFSSSDGGLHWTRIAEPSQTGFENVISVVRTSSATLLAATQSALLRSTDAGQTWTRVNSPAPVPARARAKAARPAVKGRAVAHAKTAPRSVAPAAEQPINIATTHVNALLALPGTVLAGSEAGLFRSTDDGETWAPVKNASAGVRSLIHSEFTYAVLPHGLLVSKDDGASWTEQHLPFFAEIYDVSAAGDFVLAGTSRGIFHSNDMGATWHAAQSGVPLASMTAVVIDPVSRRLAFAFEYGNLYRSLDAGKTWQHYDQEGLGGALVRNFAITTQGPRNLLAVTATRGIFVREIEEGTAPRSSYSAVELRKDRYVPNQQNDKTPAF